MWYRFNDNAGNRFFVECENRTEAVEFATRRGYCLEGRATAEELMKLRRFLGEVN